MNDGEWINEWMNQYNDFIHNQLPNQETGESLSHASASLDHVENPESTSRELLESQSLRDIEEV